MTHTVQYFMPVYCSVKDHPGKPSWHARSTSLIQTNFPSFKSHQLPIAPELHVEACESLFLPSSNLEWLDLMKILCREAELSWAHECHGSILPRWHCVAPVFPTSASCKHSTHSFSMVPEPWWKELIMYVPFAVEQSTNRCFLHLDQLRVSTWVTSHYAEKLL